VPVQTASEAKVSGAGGSSRQVPGRGVRLGIGGAGDRPVVVGLALVGGGLVDGGGLVAVSGLVAVGGLVAEAPGWPGWPTRPHPAAPRAATRPITVAQRIQREGGNTEHIAGQPLTCTDQAALTSWSAAPPGGQ
jgi:hypothetical protein